MWTLQEFHWVISNENMLADKGAGSPSWILPPGRFSCRPISEPTEQMCDVSLHCFAIGGLPFHVPPSCLGCFPHCSTSTVPPTSPHEPARSHLSLWLLVQCTAKEIPPTEKPEHVWQINVLSNPPRHSQPPYKLLTHESSHWWCELESTANCLGCGWPLRGRGGWGVSISQSWLSSC